MSKTIYLFRHGQTDWNLARRMQGHTDIPLNEEGCRQAATLQEFFKNNPVELMVSSDLTRAKQTAEIANTYLQAQHILNSDFREVFLGDIEGLTQDEIIARYGEDQWLKWTSHESKNFSFTYQNGESALSAIERFQKGLTQLCLNSKEERIGVCTHGLMMRRFLHSLRPDLKEAIPIPNCVVYTIQWSRDLGFTATEIHGCS
ncbi:MAG: histidine phosphatase family protein [Bacillota bacterium]